MSKLEEKVVAAVKGDSPEKKEFKKIVDAYAKSNPVKFELKKAALEAKLASL